MDLIRNAFDKYDFKWAYEIAIAVGIAALSTAGQLIYNTAWDDVTAWDTLQEWETWLITLGTSIGRAAWVAFALSIRVVLGKLLGVGEE